MPQRDVDVVAADDKGEGEDDEEDVIRRAKEGDNEFRAEDE